MPYTDATSTMAGLDSNVPRPTVAQMQQAHIFQGIDERVLLRVANQSVIVSHPEGIRLCRQGSPADALMVLLEGRVALENSSPNGASAVVEVIAPGGHFMLSAALSGLPLLMSARSVTPVRVMMVQANGLRAMLSEEPSLASAMLRAEAIDFGAMVRQVCDLKLRTTAQRLGCYLLELTNEVESNTVSLRLPFDKRLLAARLGCRQENLSRAFAALRSLGVETHGARVILHDIASLRDYSLPDSEGDTETA